jgi:hypothetical protein
MATKLYMISNLVVMGPLNVLVVAFRVQSIL